MSYRKLKTLDYLVTVVLTLITAIVVLGVATCKHASAEENPHTGLCYGYLRNIGPNLGTVGTQCVFLKNSSVGEAIVKTCGWGNYCRVLTDNRVSPLDLHGDTMHRITIIYGIDTNEENDPGPFLPDSCSLTPKYQAMYGCDPNTYQKVK